VPAISVRDSSPEITLLAELFDQMSRPSFIAIYSDG